MKLTTINVNPFQSLSLLLSHGVNIFMVITLLKISQMISADVEYQIILESKAKTHLS